MTNFVSTSPAAGTKPPATNGPNKANALATALLLLPICYTALVSVQSVFPHSRGVLAAVAFLGGIIKIANALNPNTAR